ncbi:MAG TPA: TIGR01459 family HAD-type hydrolase [Rhizomicrobium sp.]|nr:TIGR01459 family HAD-type hydrolase [Rhizomicrobium sp.]
MTGIPILAGLSEIAQRYDALFCDIWGVLHNGREAYTGAIDALNRFRAECGPAILLTNAPRPVSDIEEYLLKVGVPLDCYDAIISSGAAAREDLEWRLQSSKGPLPILHLGPERDRGVFEGLAVECVDIAKAEIVMCTGLFDDDIETPDDYAPDLRRMAARHLPMLCANPDIVVQRGDRLIWCAGALAEAYEKLGGTVTYYGKPHPAIYEAAFRAAQKAAGRPITKPLAIGDGADTDIKGANGAGIDAVFVAQGVHAAQLGDLTAEGLAQLFAVPEAHPKAAMRTLVW